MKFKGQLKYSDGSKTKVQFHYKKSGSNASTKTLEVEKLPEDLLKKLLLKPDGVGMELPVTENGRIDLEELQQQGTPGGGPTQRAQSQGGGGGGWQQQSPRQQQNQAPPREIARAVGDYVEFTDKGSIEREKINVTDPALGLKAGNQIEDGRSLLKLVRFGPGVTGLAGQEPDIDRNPYSQVEFAGPLPWTDGPASDLTHKHPMAGRLHGTLTFTMRALTPLFVPGGFPFGRDKRDKEEAKLRETPRHFFRMEDAGSTERYAIPGSSLKGVLRTEVEAISNSRLGVLLDEDFFAKPIPYRRRSYEAGELKRFDAAKNAWEVQPVTVLYLSRRDWPKPPTVPGDVSYDAYVDRYRNYARPGLSASGAARPFYGGLAVADIRKPYFGLIVEPKRGAGLLTLPGAVAEAYQANLTHPHYQAHIKNEEKAEAGKKKYNNIKKSVREGLQAGDLIYYTVENGKITTFGKNVNYLWPSSTSITKLCAAYVTPDKLGLGDALTMAERLFGFSGEHTRDRKSHPFRGLLRFETAWGPQADSFPDEKAHWPELTKQTAPGTEAATAGWKIAMAPLTGPATRAKSRPLYLKAKPDGSSGSWEDADVQLRGRKFYWPQSDEQSAGNVWPFHLRDEAHERVKTQLPPMVHALKPGTEFACRIHFRNLSEAELGALVYVLEGETGTHTLRIGKGKPRGLGNVRCQVTAVELDGDPAALLEDPVAASVGDKARYLGEFKSWVTKKAGVAAFEQAEHVKSYVKLHEWRGGRQICNYPVNFGQYGWLPGDHASNTRGEPNNRQPRPVGMKPAWRAGGVR